MKKVLAASWHPGGINAIIPVIKRLRKECKVEVVAIGHEYSESILQNACVAYKTIKDCDVSGASIKSVLEKESPDIVLTGTSAQDKDNPHTIEQSVIAAAKEKGIPSIAVLDFWGTYWQRFSDLNTGERLVYMPDTVAIMDNYAKTAMINEGFDAKKLVITGNPHFDSIEEKARNFGESKKQAVRQKIGIDADVLAFYAGNVFKNESKDFGFWDLDNVSIICECLDYAPGAGVVVKLHPRVPESNREKILHYISQNGKGRIKLVSDIGPQELSLASDVVFTPFSTVGIEAVLMGKPCISMQPGLIGENLFAVMAENGIVDAGYTAEECKSLVAYGLRDSNYRNKLKEKASKFKTDGKATERVTQLVYDMIA